MRAKDAKRQVERAKKAGDEEGQKDAEEDEQAARDEIKKVEQIAEEAGARAVAAIEAASQAETTAIAAAIVAAEAQRVAHKQADDEAQKKAEHMAVAAAAAAVGAPPPVFEDSEGSDPGDTPVSPKAGALSAADKAAIEQGKVAAGINMVRVEPAKAAEATAKYANAGSARMDSRSGIPAIKYTSGKPPKREPRILRITEERDITWAKQEDSRPTVLKIREGDITRLVHGMALKSRKAADIKADRSWLSFFLIAQPPKEKEQRVYQFSCADEELFTQAFLALHKLLRDFSSDPNADLVGMSTELTIVDVQEMMADYKRKDDESYELCGCVL